MKKLMIMAFLAVCMTANAGNLFSNAGSDSKKDLVLKSGKNGDLTMHFGLGVNLVSGAPEGYEFAPFKSWDFQWTVAQYDYNPKGASQTYSIGLGLNWRRYGLKDNNTMFEKVHDVVGLGKFVSDAGSRHSNVHTLGINIPLLFTQKLGKSILPVEMVGMPSSLQIISACVPLPAPGAPSKIRFIGFPPFFSSR